MQQDANCTGQANEDWLVVSLMRRLLPLLASLGSSPLPLATPESALSICLPLPTSQAVQVFRPSESSLDVCPSLFEAPSTLFAPEPLLRRLKVLFAKCFNSLV